ncbi:unnamed protein product [Lota lota]
MDQLPWFRFWCHATMAVGSPTGALIVTDQTPDQPRRGQPLRTQAKSTFTSPAQGDTPLRQGLTSSAHG